MKYIALGAATGIILAIVLQTLPRKTYSEFPQPGYDDYTYSGGFQRHEPQK